MSKNKNGAIAALVFCLLFVVIGVVSLGNMMIKKKSNRIHPQKGKNISVYGLIVSVVLILITAPIAAVYWKKESEDATEEVKSNTTSDDKPKLVEKKWNNQTILPETIKKIGQHPSRRDFNPGGFAKWEARNLQGRSSRTYPQWQINSYKGIDGKQHDEYDEKAKMDVSIVDQIPPALKPYDQMYEIYVYDTPFSPFEIVIQGKWSPWITDLEVKKFHPNLTLNKTHLSIREETLENALLVLASFIDHVQNTTVLKDCLQKKVPLSNCFIDYPWPKLSLPLNSSSMVPLE